MEVPSLSLCNEKNFTWSREDTICFFLLKKVSLVGLAHSLEWTFHVSTWPLTSPI